MSRGENVVVGILFIKRQSLNVRTGVLLPNYAWDWPTSITNAQERLVGIQLEKERRIATVAADLEKAKGDLEVAKAQKLVEMQKAEAVAEGIKIVKDQLKDSPEYLKWHEIRMLAEAAQGPNNAFIIVPYGNFEEMRGPALANAQLHQMLKATKIEITPEPKPE